MKILGFIAALLVAFPVRAAPDVESGGNFATLSAEKFRELDALRQPIEPETFDPTLLEAAIFHESNRVRNRNGRSRLEYSERAARAARAHSVRMEEGSYLSHGEKQAEETSSPLSRLRQVGLHPSFLAENVAFTFRIDYDSGRKVYVRKRKGRRVFSYEPGGEPLPARTYAGFAESIVAQLMDSPPHRRNLLSRKPTRIGVGVAMSRAPDAMDRIFVTQDFFAALTEG